MAAADVRLDTGQLLRALDDLTQAHAALGDEHTALVLAGTLSLLEQQQAELSELLDLRHKLLADIQQVRRELARWRPVASVRQDDLQTVIRVCVGGECQQYQVSTREYQHMGSAVRYIAAGCVIKGLYQAAVAAMIPTEVNHVSSR